MPLFLRAVEVALATSTNSRASKGKGSLEEEAPSVVASAVSSTGFQENPLTQSWPCLLYIKQILATPLLMFVFCWQNTESLLNTLL